MAKAFLTRIRGPKRLNIFDAAMDEIRKEMNARIKPAMEKSLERVVADWKNKPDFKSRTVIKRNEVAVYTFPAGENKEIFGYVDKGTKPHRMPAVSGKLMVFQAGGKYVPKTMAKPARTVVGGGYVQGGVKTFTTKRREYTHPGSEGRDFTGTIARDLQPEFKKAMDAAFARAARKANK